MRQHKLWLCTLLVLLLAALGAFGAAAETTVGMSGAGSFKMEQVYVNVPELDVYFYALDGDGNSYSPIKVQAAGPELTLGNRRLEVRSVAAASDPICYILALDNSKSIEPSEFYTMLGGVRKLINAMGDDDQLMLYTTAGSTECVLPATSDKNLMYKTLGSIKQVEGSLDTARLISAVYSELQSDYQALAPRKAAMIVTDAGQVLTNMALFATLASDVGDQIGMAAYIYLMTDRPGMFETLESAADGRLVLCEASTLGDELKKKQEYFATALEIKTEVPESLYGERLETLTLAMPQLGSAIRSSQTVYMGYRLAKPQVTKVETLRRDKLRLTAVVANELEIMDGKFTGNVIGDIVDAQYKAKTLTRLAQEYEIPLAQTVAIGDGANDLPMIKAAGLGIAYHAKPKVNEKTEVTIRHADLMGVFCILSGSLNQK